MANCAFFVALLDCTKNKWTEEVTYRRLQKEELQTFEWKAKKCEPIPEQKARSETSFWIGLLDQRHLDRRLLDQSTPPPKENLANWNKQNNGTLGYTQGPPVIKNQQKLKSRVGQFLRLLHKIFCLASDRKVLLIKKLHISKKWSHAKFQLLKPQTDRAKAKKPLEKG